MQAAMARCSGTRAKHAVHDCTAGSYAWLFGQDEVAQLLCTLLFHWHPCLPAAGSLGCITDPAQRRAKVVEAMQWSWKGYK